MSWWGEMMGLPLWGLNTLLVLSMRVEASTWASKLRGRWTAI